MITTNCAWTCNYHDNNLSSWNHLGTYTVSTIKAQAPLGSGHISNLAQKADDLGLNPKCSTDEGIAYLKVSSRNRKKMEDLDKCAKEMGFAKGEVDIAGEPCLCYL